VSDEMVEAYKATFAECMQDWLLDPTGGVPDPGDAATRAALTAALAARPKVRVKALEWKDGGLGIRYARTPFGAYAMSTEGFWWNDTLGAFGNGQDFAQADYDRRILSALEDVQ